MLMRSALIKSIEHPIRLLQNQVLQGVSLQPGIAAQVAPNDVSPFLGALILEQYGTPRDYIRTGVLLVRS